MIKHILVSRFAVEGNKLKLTEDWIDHRLDLLEKYCYPSIENQTDQEFEWWVFNSENIFNDEQLNRINNLTRFKNIYIDSKSTNYGEVLKKLLCEVDYDELITTRVDCDDALHKNFIYDIKDNLKNNDKPYVLNFSTGFEYNTQSKLLTKRSRKDSNMFISLVEKKSENLKTVLCKQHQRMKKEFKVYQLNFGKPSWLQLIHGQNICTTKNLSLQKATSTEVQNIKEDFNVII